MSTSMRERFDSGHEMTPPTPKELEDATASYLEGFHDLSQHAPEVMHEATIIGRVANPFGRIVPVRLSAFGAAWLSEKQGDVSALDLEWKRRHALSSALWAYLQSGNAIDKDLVREGAKRARLQLEDLRELLAPTPDNLKALGVRHLEHQELWHKPAYRAMGQLGLIPFFGVRKRFGSRY